MTFLAGQIATAAELESRFVALEEQPVVAVFSTVAQTLSSGVLTAMAANGELYDSHAMHSTSTNTSRVTCTKAGKYLVSAVVSFAVNGAGDRAVEFRVNGSVNHQAMKVKANDAAETRLPCQRRISLAVGDYVEVMAFQASGGSLAVTLQEFAAEFVRV